MPVATPARARYRRILRFAAWHLTVTWWYELFLPRVGLRRVSERTRPARMRRFARRFRGLAIDLGGLMIKLGQFMSSRLDVLPPEITRELEGLQDEVPAVDFAAIHDAAEIELGVAFDRVYDSFDCVPIAAASLGQAYKARLAAVDAQVAGFADVVVKVQRPGIGAIVDVDLAALRRVGGWLSRVALVSRRVDMPALVEEFALTSLQEIDYLHEAAQAERFAENFAGDARVRVPRVVWERSTRAVLTLEDVSAIKINDLASLRLAGIDPREVAAVFAELMFDQLFVHGFVHADPHPGNLFITPLAPAEGDPAFAITFVDFGMMSEVPDVLRATLRKLVIAAAARDGKGMVAAMSEAGVLLPTADTAELEHVMTQVFARFGGMGFAELRELDPKEFREFALQFSDVLLSLPFQLPENFLLIMRAFSLTSGMCSSLDPDYNVWDSVEPYADQLIRGESVNLVKDIAGQAWDLAGLAWRLPKRVDEVLNRVQEGDLPVSAPRLEAGAARLDRSVRRAVSALVFGALLIAGALLRAADDSWGTMLMAASVIPLLHAVFSGGVRR